MKVETDCWDCRGGRGQAAVGHEPERMAGERKISAEKYSWTKRMTAETPEERERRLQRMSTNQHKTVSSWEPTSMKGWQLKHPRRDKADEPQPAQKVGSWNPRGERKKITANVPSTAQRPTEQDTIQQSINDNLISKCYSILQHVNYSAATWKFGANCFNVTEVLYSAVRQMKHVQSDVMCHKYKCSWYLMNTEHYNTFRIVMCRLPLLLLIHVVFLLLA